MTNQKPMPTPHKSSLFIISGPSGAGEDSVIEGMQERGLETERVITTTTRPMRKGEEQGKPYYFIPKDEFEKKIKAEGFAEWSESCGYYYGCTIQELERVENSGKIGIWKVEYKGTKKIKEKFSEIVAILIAPPSIEILEKRLIRRGQDSPGVIKDRLKYAREWMSDTSFYDYEVVNEEGRLGQTIDKVLSIIKKHS